MSFSKREDGFWHWEARAGYRKGSCRNLWLGFGITEAVIFFVCLLPVLFGTRPIDILLVMLLLFAGMSAFLAVVFLLIWLPIHFFKHTYRYTANEYMLCPFGRMIVGQRMTLHFSRVKSLQQCREREAISVHSDVPAFDIYASEEDYDQVWNFLKTCCPEAEVIEEEQKSSADEPLTAVHDKRIVNNRMDNN